MTSADQGRPPDDLVARIAADLRPVRPTGTPGRRVVWWAPLALAAAAGVPLVVGLRADAPALGPVVTWGASAAQLALGVWLVWAGGRESVAGRRLPMRVASVALVLAAALILVLTAVTFTLSPTTLPGSLTAWHAGSFCFRGSLVVGSPLLLLAGWLLGRALPGQPWLAGALFGGGAGLTADAGWRLVCPVSDPWHVLAAHGSAILVLTAVGSASAYLAARRRTARPIR